MPKSGKKVLRFDNTTSFIENIIYFFKKKKKKVNYVNLNALLEGKTVKITVSGPRDLQYLACDALKELADKFLYE